MTADGMWMRTRDGSAAVLVRLLPTLTAAALVMTDCGLWLMSEAEQARRDGGGAERGAIMVVTAVVAIALLRTTAFTALVAAALVTMFCAVIDFNYNHYPAPDVRLPWRPYLIASAGLVVLVGLLCAMAAFRAIRASALPTPQTRLAAVAAYREPQPNLLGKALVAAAAGGVGTVVAGAGVRHAWNSRHALPPLAVAGLIGVLVLVWWLLAGDRARQWADRGRTAYLVPALIAVAGLGAAPFAVARLWSYQRPLLLSPPQPAILIAPGRTWFDPESGGLGAVTGCLLMAAAGGTLLTLRALNRKRRPAGAAAAVGNNADPEPDARSSAP